MSKDNLFLGMARGSVGDVVFSRLNGVQVARARNRAPKNPQAPAQLLQRIVFNTCSKAYSRMQAICNHSFEGYAEGTPCQARFMQLNADYLRSLLAIEVASGEEETMEASVVEAFNQKSDAVAVCNPYIISEGSLPSMNIVAAAAAGLYNLTTPHGTITLESTYDEVISALGLQRGDQLTFVVATWDTSTANLYMRGFITAFDYARIILEPSDGDFTHPFFTSGGTTQAVNMPNSKNQGALLFNGLSSAGSIQVNSINTISKTADDATNGFYPVLGTVIASRYVGNRWARSTQSLQWTRAAAYRPDEDTFKMAYLSYKKSVSSSLYLNQAE